MSKQLRRWAFTLTIHEDTPERHDEVIASLTSFCCRWIFQKEQGENGLLHFQGRFSAKSPLRANEIHIKAPLPWATWHLSPEHDTAAGTFYSTKEETRIAGPWSDKLAAIWIPPQYQINEYNDFQSYILYLLDGQDNRQILFIEDCKGNLGKTTLVGHMECKGLALSIPATMASSQEMMQFAYGLIEDPKEQLIIFLDVPRAVDSRQSWSKWLAAIECLKSGVCYDGRYTARKKYFHWPQIAVFANTLPPQHMLSHDRYQIYQP